MAIDSRNTFVYSPLDLAVATASSTGAAACTTTQAAGATGIRNICKRVTVTLGVGATLQPPVQVQLINGASGLSNTTSSILANWIITALVSGAQTVLDVDNLHIAGSTATAMTLFVRAPAANTNCSINLETYTFPRANPAQVTSAA